MSSDWYHLILFHPESAHRQCHCLSEASGWGGAGRGVFSDNWRAAVLCRAAWTRPGPSGRVCRPSRSPPPPPWRPPSATPPPCSPPPTSPRMWWPGDPRVCRTGPRPPDMTPAPGGSRGTGGHTRCRAGRREGQAHTRPWMWPRI